MFFGLIDHGSERSVNYKGDLESGMLIEIDFKNDGVTGTISITNTLTRESLSIDISKVETIIGSTLDAGDIIFIDTRIGQKSVTFERSGVRTNILNAFNRGSDWLTLSPGKNTFSYSATSGVEKLQFKFITNLTYEGV